MGEQAKAKELILELVTWCRDDGGVLKGDKPAEKGGKAEDDTEREERRQAASSQRSRNHDLRAAGRTGQGEGAHSRARHLVSRRWRRAERRQASLACLEC